MTEPLTHRVALLMAKRSNSGEFRQRTEIDVATALSVTPSEAQNALASLTNLNILTFEVYKGLKIYTAAEPKPRNMAGRPKKSTDAEFRAMWNSGASIIYMQAHFGYSGANSVRTRANRMMLTPRVRVTITKMAPAELALIWGCLDVTIEEMARHFGVNDRCIRTRAGEMGLPSRDENRKGRKPLCTDDQFRDLWESGMPTDDMAFAMGYTDVRSVTARSRRMGLPSRAENRKGQKPLCTDDHFRDLWESGMPTDDMAFAMGYTDVRSVTARRRRMGLKSRYAPRIQATEQRAQT